MKNILILSELSLWSMKTGSGAPSYYNTVKGYVNSGWNTFLIQLDNGIDVNIEGLRYYGIKIPFTNLKKIKGIGPLVKTVRHYYITKLFFKKAEEILNRISNRNNTIIYAYEVGVVEACKNLSKKYNLPLVTRFQGTILSGDKANTFRFKISQHIHYKALSTPSDLVIMTNDGTKGDKILDKLNNKSKRLFLLNGLDPIDFNKVDGLDIMTDFPSSCCIFLTVSRLARWKRVDRAIKAFAEIKHKYNNIRLVVVGDGPERQNLENLAKNLGVKNDVKFEGSLPHEMVYAYMLKTDIFLSLYDLSNMGNPLFEAMKCGKAIITLDTGNTASIIKSGENGIVVPFKDQSLIPIKMSYLLDNPIKRKEMGEKAKISAEQIFMTWEERINYEILEVSKLIKE